MLEKYVVPHFQTLHCYPIFIPKFSSELSLSLQTIHLISILPLYSQKLSFYILANTLIDHLLQSFIIFPSNCHASLETLDPILFFMFYNSIKKKRER